MQQLKFHPKWDKTIAEEDRNHITQSFQQADLSSDKTIQFTSLWHVKNHRGDLLVTTIVHNTSESSAKLDNQILTCHVNGKEVAEHTFSPPFTFETKTSMPWTFIFPEGSFAKNVHFDENELTIHFKSYK
ncbi:SLAP domain-containing protein [Virgibacillus doumboii]|uniref:SLAP domain-containing protein n=1 Tax=Virgibacillus doumboii TaxID=2697503 RepID=UPI0013DF6E6A|nr:SLAP domain-containing protein [Virgibacillus doumboii]